MPVVQLASAVQLPGPALSCSAWRLVVLSPSLVAGSCGPADPGSALRLKCARVPSSGTCLTRSVADDVTAIGQLPAVAKILQAVSQVTGLRFAAVARVTETDWTACAVQESIGFGLSPGDQLALESTICNEIRQHRQPVVFGHASAHPEFSTHATPRLYGFESYISIPIVRRDGSFFGTLCALDPEPRRLDDPAIVRTLELFAELLAEQLEAHEGALTTARALARERDVGVLREQFMAVLGHDLRNPLQVVSLYTRLLQDESLPAAWAQQLDDMARACARMSELIDNMLDLARGRLGDGIPVSVRSEPRFDKVLSNLVSEVGAAFPGTPMLADLQYTGPVDCDRHRMSQLVANLLVNAASHGGQGRPVRLISCAREGWLELMVANEGEPIPDHRRAELFAPFTRLESGNAAQGLGLGLYIAAQIAKAHGGMLELASSDSSGTCFRCRIPLAGQLLPGSTADGDASE